MRSEGNATLFGLRDTLREAYRLGLIEAGETWILMIQDRNLTTHTCNRATADAITGQILNSYLPCFLALRLILEQRLQQGGG